MIIFEILALAFGSLKANKLRSGLTMLGIGVGVFSVIGVMTIISALRGQIESRLSVLGANSFEFSKYPAILTDSRKYANRRNIDFAEASRFQQLMGDAAEVNLRIQRGYRRAFYADRRTNPTVQLTGSDDKFTVAFNYDISNGRNIGPSDVEFGRAVCVIGDDIVKELFPNENPLGALIRIDGQSYTVIGAFAPKGSSFGQSQDSNVVVPITRWLQIYGAANRSIGINVQAHSQTELPIIREKAVGVMRLVRGLAPEDGNDFEVFSNDSLIESFNQIAGVVAVGALVISGIALVASGVGVMNIMLVSVTERTKEIGIRKSIGAKRRSILVQFLIEAIALSILGGFAGVVVGIGLGDGVALLMHVSLVFPWGWAITGLTVCATIGITFGLYPAWKAARLDPIEALRYE